MIIRTPFAGRRAGVARPANPRGRRARGRPSLGAGVQVVGMGSGLWSTAGRTRETKSARLAGWAGWLPKKAARPASEREPVQRVRVPRGGQSHYGSEVKGLGPTS